MSSPLSPVSPIRKKRNFKALQLAPQPPKPTAPPPPAPEPVAVRPAPTTAGTASAKKRPPPMTLKAPKIPSNGGAVSAIEQETPNDLMVVSNGPNSAPNTASPSMRRNTYHATLSNTLANLDMNAEIKFDLRNEDLKDLQELGQGNGGSVKKVEHTPTGTFMAKKIVLIDAKPSVRKQILRELQIMHDCKSKYIISFWGAFLADPNICICMEFMDKGSLDGIYKKIGPIDIDVVRQVALAVLEGLTYLYDVHRIIHRAPLHVMPPPPVPPCIANELSQRADIKPSNILCNSRGEIKICDFGVSGELINSIADTFVGTSTYMSPERIQGAQYTVKSDVWSLGISLIELALGRFPFSESSDSDSDLSDFEGTLSPARPGPLPPRIKTQKKEKKDKRKSKGVSLQGGGMTMSILELLQHIVNEPAPRLTPEGRFPREAEAFVDSCLLKDPEQRKTPKDLLKDIWIEQARVSNFDLEAWANSF
ncbi:putative serine/Threonine protein kinases, catalytic domain [Lyophyllum shimeji]|uniref:Serine/Threonine protein kinases, catalytic domain n=1 Tax=Lyophyllum shimeji TaxID=47721 RepID=A0A9P3PLR5_LYOSH|nr:putative serine/Threonine protein kinases, catalytic domain [Lyophyllum shimeji]